MKERIIILAETDMNNSWILCGVAACLLLVTVSCSTSADAVLEEEVASADVKQDENPDAYDEEEHLFDDVPDDGIPQVITLQSAPSGQVVTKGTGTVGAVRKNGTGTGGDTEKDSHWQYEDIYVLMMTDDKYALYKEDIDKEWYYTSINLKKDGIYSSKGYQFDNTFWSRPEKDAEGKYTLNYREDPRSKGDLRYYPYSNGEKDEDGKIIERKSRFFAYYIDDAAVETVAGSPKIEGLEETVTKPTRATVKFHIDGSQDLMCGYASAVYPYKGEYKTLTYFSARSARAGVIPALNMEHLLTRFQFRIVAGDNDVYGTEKSSPVTVTAIKVRSKSVGTMLVAAKDFDEYKNGYCEISDWSNDEWFSLKEIDKTQTPSIGAGKPKLKALSPVEMNAGMTPDIGEALFVQPGQEKYELVLCTSQWLNGDGPNVGGSYEKKEEIMLEISSEDIPKFERGMSYNVTIYVYSYQEVKIQVKANAWEAGGDVEIGGDEWK